MLGLGPRFGYGKHIITLGYYEIVSFEKVSLAIASKRVFQRFWPEALALVANNRSCSGQPRSFSRLQSLRLRYLSFCSTIESSPDDALEWPLSFSVVCKWRGSSVSHVRRSSPVPLLRTIGTKQSLGAFAPTLLPCCTVPQVQTSRPIFLYCVCRYSRYGAYNYG